MGEEQECYLCAMPPQSDVIAVNTFCKSTTLTSFPEEFDIQVLLDLGGALRVKAKDHGLAMNHSKTLQRKT